MRVLCFVSPVTKASRSRVASVILHVSLVTILHRRWKLMSHFLCRALCLFVFYSQTTMCSLEFRLCNRIFCCSRAVSTRVMNPSVMHVTRPALTAQAPASGTAQCALRCRSCPMMAAACRAVKKAAMINRYRGSAVTAWRHKVRRIKCCSVYVLHKHRPLLRLTAARYVSYAWLMGYSPINSFPTVKSFFTGAYSVSEWQMCDYPKNVNRLFTHTSQLCADYLHVI